MLYEPVHINITKYNLSLLFFLQKTEQATHGESKWHTVEYDKLTEKKSFPTK